MIITKTIDGNEAVLKVEGRLDTLNSPELSEEIDGLGEDISSIVMDFSELEYISSSGLRVVIIAKKKSEWGTCNKECVCEDQEYFRDYRFG
jgi:anti-sigma B factor antagonist